MDSIRKVPHCNTIDLGLEMCKIMEGVMNLDSLYINEKLMLNTSRTVLILCIVMSSEAHELSMQS